MPHGLSHGDEGAGFVEVVDCFTRRAIGLGRAAFPGQGVAVPTEEGEAATKFALFACPFVLVPVRTGFRAMLVVSVGVFVDAPPQRVVGVVDAEGVAFKAHQTVEQVPAQSQFLKERCSGSTVDCAFRSAGNQCGTTSCFHSIECNGNAVNGVSRAALGNGKNPFA